MADHAQPKSGIQLTNSSYDVVHNIAIYAVPALGVFYFTFAGIWGLPYAEQVGASLAAFGTLLSVIVALARRSFKNTDVAHDGALVVDDTSSIVSLDVQTPFDQMAEKSYITLLVKNRPGTLTSVQQPIPEVIIDEVGPASQD